MISSTLGILDVPLSMTPPPPPSVRISATGRCSSNPCGSTGVCSVTTTGHTCTCQDDYTGHNCETGKLVWDKGTRYQRRFMVFKTDITHDRLYGISINIFPLKHSLLQCVYCTYEVKVVSIRRLVQETVLGGD